MNVETRSQQKENVDKVGKLYSSIFAGDFDTVNAILSPDVVVHEAAALPYGGAFKGHEGFQELMVTLAGVWEDLKPIDMKMSGVDDLVLCHFTLTAKNRKTGSKLNMPLIEAWTLRDGRVVEGRVYYYDTMEVRQICGLE